jgi:Ca2+-dependent lipid-binding protein
LELKPEGKLMVTVVRAKALKNKEVIGKSDPYVIVYIRPILKVKTRVIDDNLNPEWNETFHLFAEDKETQSLYLEVQVLLSFFKPYFQNYYIGRE